MSTSVKNVCVFCGSREGSKGIYASTATSLGKYLAKNKIRLIFGGGQVGLMGLLANAVLQEGGEVVGVIPRMLYDKELANPAIHKLVIVDSMHQRKQKMYQLADAFIVLPGGVGTMEEAFEVWTWLQLGIHKKPIALLNVNSFYDSLLHFIEVMYQEDFIKVSHKKLLCVGTDIEKLFYDLNYSLAQYL